MHRRRPPGTKPTLGAGLRAGLAVAVTIGLTPACITAASAAAAPAAAAAGAEVSHQEPLAAPGAGSRTITLITGDVVTVGSARTARGRPSVRVRMAPGRERVPYLVRQVGADTLAYPVDAWELVLRGTLDRRLFNVTELLRAGYDDAARSTVPLIVQYRTSSAVAAQRSIGLTGLSSRVLGQARVRRELPVIDGVAAVVEKRSARTLWQQLSQAASGSPGRGPAAVSRVWLDGRRHVMLDQSTRQIGAPTAWAAGFTGKGVRVAVLDTGVDATHPDLKGKVVAAKNFDRFERDGRDLDGHGTHVASTIAGSGAASGGKYRGVAPDAKILAGKVCNAGGCEDSAILAGMEWAAKDQKADVVNMSLGGPDTADYDPMEQAADSLSKRFGTLFVVAAGNSGPRAGTVSTPSTAEAALAVAAVDRTGATAGFSSRGPRLSDVGAKPEISGPGVGIVAARAAGVAVRVPVGKYYQAASGTSMATPHVVGAAAVLAERFPTVRGQDLKALLMASARPRPGATLFDQGAGLVDLAKGIGQRLTGTSVLSFGRPVWPHGDDTPITRQLTYRNPGSAPLTLSLAVSSFGPDGASTSGVFTVATSRLVVPAGGSASTTVTARTSAASLKDGVHSARVSATAGPAGAPGQSMVSTLSVVREVESYDLTLKFIGEDGKPHFGDAFLFDVKNYLTNDQADVLAETGQATVRLPAKRYDVIGTLGFDINDPLRWVLTQNLVLDRDRVVIIDARKTKPFRLTSADRGARATSATVLYDHEVAGGEGWYGLVVGAALPEDLETAASPLANNSSDRSRVAVDVALSSTGPRGPVLTMLHKEFTGRLPAGYVRRYPDRELAISQDTVMAQRTGDTARIGTVEGAVQSALGEWTGKLPVTLTRKYSTESARTWLTDVAVRAAGAKDDTIVFNDVRRYPKPGRFRQVWNQGPFGPGFGQDDRTPPTAFRDGDLFQADGTMMSSDAARHRGSSGAITMALYRNGTLIAQENRFAFFDRIKIPAAAASYRLDVTTTRDPGLVGSQIPDRATSSWTFRSARTTPGVATALPLAAIRFTPRLSASGRAPSGAFDVPVAVQPQPGARIPGLRLRSVSVSYDLGRTWSAAPVRRTGATTAVVRLRHPAGARVSFRARVTGDQGVSVTQTVIGSYRVMGSSSSVR